jgi:hypothetical protein
MLNQLVIAIYQAPKPPILGALNGSYSPRIGGWGAVRLDLSHLFSV